MYSNPSTEPLRYCYVADGKETSHEVFEFPDSGIALVNPTDKQITVEAVLRESDGQMALLGMSAVINLCMLPAFSLLPLLLVRLSLLV